MNYRQLYAIKAANEARIKKLRPDIDAGSGIYVFTRVDELGIKYAYIGQAVSLLKRVAEHLSGYQYIDLSIKKHGLHDAKKCPYGWGLSIYLRCDVKELDNAEQRTIKTYAQLGYQLRNKTTGGQNDGKKSISDYGRSGYLKGKNDGQVKAIKEIGTAIEKYTTGLISKGGAIADRKTQELINKLKSFAE